MTAKERTAIVALGTNRRYPDDFTPPEIGFAFSCPGVVTRQRLVTINVKKTRTELSRCREETRDRSEN